jgi:hypothetical protein
MASLIAVEVLIAWAGEQHRQPAGGVRQVYIHNPANGDTGPDCDFAVPLK